MWGKKLNAPINGLTLSIFLSPSFCPWVMTYGSSCVCVSKGLSYSLKISLIGLSPVPSPPRICLSFLSSFAEFPPPPAYLHSSPAGSWVTFLEAALQVQLEWQLSRRWPEWVLEERGLLIVMMCSLERWQPPTAANPGSQYTASSGGVSFHLPHAAALRIVSAPPSLFFKRHTTFWNHFLLRMNGAVTYVWQTQCFLCAGWAF